MFFLENVFRKKWFFEIAEKRLTETYGKEKNRLQPTDIGMVVNDYLESQFEPIMDYNFKMCIRDRTIN